MKELKDYDAVTIMMSEVFEEIVAEKDLNKRTDMEARLSARAKELKCGVKFDKKLSQYLRQAEQKEKLKPRSDVEGLTNFGPDNPYGDFLCRNWIADENGIRAYSDKREVTICHHPIIPVKRMINLQTKEEQITIAFKRRGKWDSLTVPKTTITQASKICALAARSIDVTSETAKYLVSYLAEIDTLNENWIPVVDSTSKMGWVQDGPEGTSLKRFLPYDTSVAFDADGRFRSLYDSIREGGGREVWYDCIRQLRTEKNSFAVRLMMDASLASVLVHIVGTQPFIVDLWGETEGGKTVALMVAASMWGNPNKGKYLRDYDSTDVGLEAMADFLNNLPMVLDDTSKRKGQADQKFEEIIYYLCSGKGKTRSNKELGVNRETTWENVILTNGEKPLHSYAIQGGAKNRILEVEANDYLFTDPRKTAGIVRNNYGFGGKVFVQAITDQYGPDTINNMYRKYQRELASDDTMEKQVMGAALILTASEIADACLYKNKTRITPEEIRQVLTSRSEVSDGRRCYEYILDKIEENPSRFNPDPDGSNIEQWGKKDKNDNCVYFIGQALRELCDKEGYKLEAFVSWAEKHGVLVKKGNHKSEAQRIRGFPTPRSVYHLRTDMSKELDEEESQDSAGGEQMTLNTLGGFRKMAAGESPFEPNPVK